MSTDARLHGFLVNAVGFVYASLGFSLSVLAAIFSLFPRPTKPPPPLPKARPGIPPNIRVPSGSRARIPPKRSFSDQSPTSPAKLLLASEKLKELTVEEKKRARSLASHRRSRSIPIITIDYFGSTETLRKKTSADFLRAEPKALPSVTEPQVSFAAAPEVPERRGRTRSRPPPPTPMPCHDKQGFSLANLKPIFTKEKPKPERRQSSPQLCSCPSLPPICHKTSGSDGTPQAHSKSVSNSKSRKTLRKMQSAPGPVQEQLTMKFDPSFRRSIEKKKSLNLRTQPYDAPYFAPPPLPINPQKLPADSVPRRIKSPTGS
ncbi:unnamed protein product [Cyclocybe aegerita]|uniref:Uncharacterized protein n=1 Tax=Cyclocybe aegerita TaxID=1973307 RepID=A0A8S0XJZ4_CYCAE|nr:unnamed protein product [Cyclocybe aegerita]